MAFESLGVLCLALLLLASPLLQVARSQSGSEVEVAEAAEQVSDLGIVVVPAGEETELLVGMKNDGESSLNFIAIKASVHLPFDHQLLVRNLTAQAFNNATVLLSALATFPYIFTVSEYLQPGNFDLVGTIIYEIDQHPHQSVFYNGTIEVIESGSFLSMESVFLVTLGIALLILFGLWVQGQIQKLPKKTNRAPKVVVGTATRDTSLDEWLEGTAYSQLQSSKSKKKK